MKPANVLLDDEGKPWITDFGLARIETEGSMTASGDFLGTLRYMSPEQAGGDRQVVDQRADVYSLGATLYELAALRPAFTGASREALFRQITTLDPPSLRSTSAAVPAELDTILLKALEKDPADRFTTAQDLSDDLRRFVSHEPIRARRPSTLARCTKWARRHQAAAWSTVAVLLLGVVGLAVGSGLVWREQQKTADALAEAQLQREEAVTQRTAAEQKAAEADAVVNFLVNDLLAAASPERALGRDVTVKEVLAEAEKKIESAFQDQPLTEAAIRNALGNTYNELGDFAAAERHLLRVRQLRTAHLGPEHRDTLQSSDGLANTLTSQGKLEEARQLHEATLQSRRRHLGPEDPDTLASMNNLALVLGLQGRLDEAEQLFSEELEIARRVNGPDHPTTLLSKNNVAMSLHHQGKHAEAERFQREALQVQCRVLPADHPDVLTSMSNLADILWLQGKEDEARRLSTQALEGRRQVLGPTHAHTLYSLENLVNYLKDKEDYRAAEAPAREFVEASRQLASGDHPSPASDARLARALRTWALIQQQTDKREEALSTYREAMSLSTNLLNRFPDDLNYQQQFAHTSVDMASLLILQDNYEEARDVLLPAQRLLTTITGRFPQRSGDLNKLVDANALLTGAYVRLGDIASVRKYYELAKELMEDPDTGPLIDRPAMWLDVIVESLKRAEETGDE